MSAGMAAFDLCRPGSGFECTRALLKARQLELVRVRLAAGASMPRHAAPGEITLVGVAGRMRLLLDDGQQVVEPGTAVHLAAGVPHALDAQEDAVALLTIRLEERHGEFAAGGHGAAAAPR